LFEEPRISIDFEAINSLDDIFFLGRLSQAARLTRSVDDILGCLFKQRRQVIKLIVFYLFRNSHEISVF
jgi:hypothetical protein